MTNKRFAIFTIIILLAALQFNVVQAVNDKPDKPEKIAKLAPDSEVAEVDGTYDVLGQADLKVKVTVHHARQNSRKPGGGSSALVCNLPDVDSSAFVGAAGWHLSTSTPVTYRLNPGSVPAAVGGANLATIASNAFSQWSSASGGQVVFTQGTNTTIARAQLDGQNIVAFGTTSGSALAVTYTWYYPETGAVAETDTIFNSKFSWRWSNPATWVTTPGTTCAYTGVYDAQDILTHELGHWMGLNDFYTAAFTSNTMYGYGSTGETKKNSLTTGDVLGITAIY